MTFSLSPILSTPATPVQSVWSGNGSTPTSAASLTSASPGGLRDLLNQHFQQRARFIQNGWLA